MSPIKDFNLVYEAVNKEGTFSDGDTIAGTATFTLTKETKVKDLVVKAKGEARVHWSEGTGENRSSHNSHKRYFKLKEYLVPQNDKVTVLPKGVNSFKFRFKIPQGDMPSSFEGLHGKIVYMLEAKMSRSWHMPSVVQKELNFVSKSLPHHGQCPQSGSVEKEIGVFSKGQVQMSASVNMKVCSPGDTLSVYAKVRNSSSKTLKPKFSIQQKIVYRAGGSTNVSDLSLCKIVGDPITLDSEETVSCQLMIPADVILTLHNCEILSVEHYAKVYLDISFAIDPTVIFPLVIIPSSFATLQSGEAVGPYPAGAAAGPYPAGAAAGPYPAGAAAGPYPAGAAVGPYPAGVGPYPAGAAVGPYPDGAAAGPYPAGAAAGPYPAGAAAGPYPAGAAAGPYPAGAAAGLYPAGAAVGPYPAGAVGAPTYSDFGPPAFPIGPFPVPAGYGAYGYPAPDPNQHANITSGYNNQWPQQAAPFGFSSAASSSVQHGPLAPPLFQQGEEPPSYVSLFSPSQDALGGTGSNH
ncbi:arrestin domain-containing protein 3-like [Cottoperca gobio]|uniref:Arrestin domain-containing protein 3-like n=1 Tax=Cottoperca gobio TaxID=56716 RepID=A0A6J2QEW0_COTGO|nr:arrestin domain-containing protein 3-like [Cottoperca gobio]